VESAASLGLQFSRGTLGTVAVSFRSPYRTPLELVGENGSLRADDAFSVDKPIVLETQNPTAAVKQSETLSNQAAYTRQVDAFADAVEGKAVFPVSGEEGWRNQEVLDAAYRSMKTGRQEDVRPIDPL
jgi:predicted dehydrogenase